MRHLYSFLQERAELFAFVDCNGKAVATDAAAASELSVEELCGSVLRYTGGAVHQAVKLPAVEQEAAEAEDVTAAESWWLEVLEGSWREAAPTAAAVEQTAACEERERDVAYCDPVIDGIHRKLDALEWSRPSYLNYADTQAKDSSSVTSADVDAESRTHAPEVTVEIALVGSWEMAWPHLRDGPNE